MMENQLGILDDPNPEEFVLQVNRHSFGFRHHLQANPIFSLPALRALAVRRRDLPHLAYWSNGRVDVSETWMQGTRLKTSLDATLANIATNDSLVLLKRIESDSDYGATMQLVIPEVLRLCGARFSEDVEQARGTILIASPGRITSYHIDADVNFLFQIANEKVLFVHDRGDRDLLPDRQLERYFSGDINAAICQPARQNEAVAYGLKPGDGVHIPSTAPHWAQNAQGISVALSVNFDLRSVRRRGTLYRINHRLRAIGLSPQSPNSIAWRDDLKLGTAVLVRQLMRLVRPI